MSPPKVISPEFLLWSQSLLLWSIASYGVMADPLKEETAQLRWTRWMLLLSSRAVIAAALAYALSRSIYLSSLLLLTILLQPVLRYRLPMRLLAEFEGLWAAAIVVSTLAMIRHFHLPARWIPASMSPAQMAALCILASTLFLVVRGAPISCGAFSENAVHCLRIRDSTPFRNSRQHSRSYPPTRNLRHPCFDSCFG
jgi:hypothetical protein